MMSDLKFQLSSKLVTPDALTFRQVMRRLPTGVTVITARIGDQIHAMTANSFTSVSLDPLLVLVCIRQHNAMHEFVSRAGNFAINILCQEQEQIARRFAKQLPQPPDPFFDIPHHSEVTGAPVFDECIAYLDCRIVTMHDAGDHTIFIGAVHAMDFGTARDARPLLWLDGQYSPA